MNVINDFEQRVAAAISAHDLLRPGAKVMVALSGGADSVALLAVLSRLGYECVAAHCNFRLRGEESMRDMRHAEAVCASLGVELTIKYFDVEAQRRLTGESVEMACRTLRYAWFDKLLDSHRAAAIAVGHHREDNVETFMLNLMRGTGLTGLCGMRPRHNNVVRPLLDVSRSDIETYLAARGLSYVTDSTNAELVYKRNRLRNRVIPTMEAAFAGASDAILATMAHLDDANRLYTRLVTERMQLYADDKRTVDVMELTSREPQARMLLFEYLRAEGFNMSVVSDMVASAGESGLTFTSRQGVTRELSRGRLSVQRAPGAPTQSVWPVRLLRDILSPVHITVDEHDVADFKPEANAAVAYFDAVLADAPDLCLRHWCLGDRLEPYGMQGSRLVSDLFSDAKYDAAAKRDAWLLCKGSVILWVVGLRASRHFTVGPGSRRFLRLELVQSSRK